MRKKQLQGQNQFFQPQRPITQAPLFSNPDQFGMTPQMRGMNQPGMMPPVMMQHGMIMPGMGPMQPIVQPGGMMQPGMMQPGMMPLNMGQKFQKPTPHRTN